MPEISEKLAEKIREGRQYRPTAELMRALDQQGDQSGSMIVEGHACTFNTPYELYEWEDCVVNEQIDSKAFDECDMSDVIFQFDHEGRVFARNRNNTLVVSTDMTGLLVRADLSKSDGGKGLYNDITAGMIDRMSFGFTVAEDKYEYTEDFANNKIIYLRTIMKVKKLYDVSAVSIPANDGTDISARGYCDGLIAEIEAERLSRENLEKRKADCLNKLLF